MAHSSAVMVQVLYRIVTSMVFAALHSALGMYRARIYSLKHSIHSMLRAQIKRDTLYGNEGFKLGDYARIQGTYRF